MFVLVFSVVPIKPTANADAAITTLRIGMIEPIDSLNPFIGVNDNAYIFYGLVYDFLMCVDEDLNPAPNLALSWHVVPDELPLGSVWQYNLTQNAYWHDGEPFDADDVVFTFNYQIGLNWTDMWAYQPYTVLVDSVERVDEYTVRVHYKDFQGNPAPASYGASMMLPIVPEHYWSKILPSAAGFSHTNPKPLGTGPFICTDQTYSEFLTGDRLILYRNPDYHGFTDFGWDIKFERLILEFYLEPSALVTDIQRGGIDIAELSPPHYKNLVDWLAANPTSSIGIDNSLKCTQYSKEISICMSDQSGADTNLLRLDPVVRQAMAHATNKTFICDAIFKGYAEEGASIISPISPYWYWEPSPDEEYYFSVEKANELLDSAGYNLWDDDHKYRKSTPGLSFQWQDKTYTFPDSKVLEFEVVVEAELYEDLEVYNYLEEAWAECGIKLTPRVVNSALWGVIVYGGYFDLTITYWSGDPDPNYLVYIQSTYSLNGWSENWYSSPLYDENYTNSLLEQDPVQRQEYIRNCQYWDYIDAAFIVYCYPHGCHAWRNDHYTGWGDWKAHPGRSLANFWSANPLFFDLEPVVGNAPPIALLDNVAGPANQSLTITAYAFDPDEDEMTYRLVFGDGANVSGTVPSDGEISVPHSFVNATTYSMELMVYDENSADAASAPATIIGPGGNAPVSNLRLMPDSFEKLSAGRDIGFTITGKDIEDDTVDVRLDFGDSTASFSDTIWDTEVGFETATDHAFDTDSDYTLVLTASDGHNTTVMTLVLAITEEEGGTPWMLILGIVAVAAVVVVVAVFLIRRKGAGGREEEEIRLP
ncbi:MAG: hypothetical protein A3K76_07390 [Euryarchaeota archaeon RBG_13_57_23]|nr:MAG: hypothetical protein A3K76_07390 [Euryarchaeota archaeon RBG_13_57_23]